MKRIAIFSAAAGLLMSSAAFAQTDLAPLPGQTPTPPPELNQQVAPDPQAPIIVTPLPDGPEGSSDEGEVRSDRGGDDRDRDGRYGERGDDRDDRRDHRRMYDDDDRGDRNERRGRDDVDRYDSRDSRMGDRDNRGDREERRSERRERREEMHGHGRGEGHGMMGRMHRGMQGHHQMHHGPGGADAGQRPLPRGAYFKLSRGHGGPSIEIKCANRDSTEECVEAVMPLLEEILPNRRHRD